MEVARHLFEIKGYEQTAVDDIIREADIAKGTFYYYFKTKKDILIALVDSMVAAIEDHFKNLLHNEQLTAIEKLKVMLRGSEKNEIINPKVMESVHLVENREMQEALNIRLVETIAPLITAVLHQGYTEKIFKRKAETAELQIVLVGAQFILDSGLFTLSVEARQSYLKAACHLFALLTDTDPAVFNFMVEDNEA